MRSDKVVIKHITRSFKWSYIGKRVFIVPATPAITTTCALHVCTTFSNTPLLSTIMDIKHGDLRLRDHEEGPLYWCNQCGKTFTGPFAMFIRLAVEDRLKGFTPRERNSHLSQ